MDVQKNDYLCNNNNKYMKAINYLKASTALLNLSPDAYRLLSRVSIIPETGCWEWHGNMTRGYGRVKFNKKLDGAHRVSYSIFIGPIPDGMFVCHECDNPSCINPDHLFLGTPYDNVMDAISKNRFCHVGKGTPFKKKHRPLNSKLSDRVASEIKRDLSIGLLNMREIALKYGAKYQTIRDIKCGRS